MQWHGTGRAGQGGHATTPGPGRRRLPLPLGAPAARRPPRRHPVLANQRKAPGLLIWGQIKSPEAGPHWQTGEARESVRIMLSKFYPAPHLAFTCYGTRIKGVCRFYFPLQPWILRLSGPWKEPSQAFSLCLTLRGRRGVRSVAPGSSSPTWAASFRASWATVGTRIRRTLSNRDIVCVWGGASGAGDGGEAEATRRAFNFSLLFGSHIPALPSPPLCTGEIIRSETKPFVWENKCKDLME